MFVFVDKMLWNKNHDPTTPACIIGCEFSKTPSARTKDRISLALWLVHIIETSSIEKKYLSFDMLTLESHNFSAADFLKFAL